MRQTAQPRVSGWKNKASKPLAIKSVVVVAAVEMPSLTEEFVGETHRVLKYTQTYPRRNQHQKGPMCLWVAREVNES